MICVKCGKPLVESRCESCHYEHQNATVQLLGTPEESELILSWESVDTEKLQAMIYQKEQELKHLQEILAKRAAADKTGKVRPWQSPAAPAPRPTPSRPPRRPQSRVSNYPGYMEALEAYFLEQNPKGTKAKPLNTNQMLRFIYRNQLDRRYGITSAEVHEDLRQIYKKYGVLYEIEIRRYTDYMDVLTQLYLDNGKQPLSNEQIQAFLDKYQLTSRFGINAYAVKLDLRTIMEKNP